MRILIGILLLLAFDANAWMGAWAPEFKCEPAEVVKLSERSVSNFVCKAGMEDGEVYAHYSKGGMLDLNGDGIKDFVFIVPWMGCGLMASGCDVYFIVSNGKSEKLESVIGSFEPQLSDLVKIKGKVYFRHSKFFDNFEKSKHNHWVHQLFSFETNGAMKCANAEVGSPFPAATIFYDKPKFKPVELTAADLKKIAEETKPVSSKYTP